MKGRLQKVRKLPMCEGRREEMVPRPQQGYSWSLREEHGGYKDEEREGGGGSLERRVETHWQSPMVRSSWAW